MTAPAAACQVKVGFCDTPVAKFAGEVAVGATAGVPTVKIILVVLTIAPAVPVTVTVYAPGATVPESVTLVAAPGDSGLVPKRTGFAPGLPVADRFIGVEKPVCHRQSGGKPGSFWN